MVLANAGSHSDRPLRRQPMPRTARIKLGEGNLERRRQIQAGD